MPTQNSKTIYSALMENIYKSLLVMTLIYYYLPKRAIVFYTIFNSAQKPYSTEMANLWHEHALLVTHTTVNIGRILNFD